MAIILRGLNNLFLILSGITNVRSMDIMRIGVKEEVDVENVERKTLTTQQKDPKKTH